MSQIFPLDVVSHFAVLTHMVDFGVLPCVVGHYRPPFCVGRRPLLSLPALSPKLYGVTLTKPLTEIAGRQVRPSLLSHED